MKRPFVIVVTGAALVATPALAGMSFRHTVNSCLADGDTLSECVQNYREPAMPAKQAAKIAACIRGHGFNGKYVTRKQWLGCGMRELPPSE
jgi:hypothetical protein